MSFSMNNLSNSLKYLHTSNDSDFISDLVGTYFCIKKSKTLLISLSDDCSLTQSMFQKIHKPGCGVLDREVLVMSVTLLASPCTIVLTVIQVTGEVTFSGT